MKHLQILTSLALVLGTLGLSSHPVLASGVSQDHVGTGPQLGTTTEFLTLDSWLKDGKVMAVSGNWLIGGQAGNGAQKEFLGTCIQADGTVGTTQTLKRDTTYQRWALVCPDGGRIVRSDKNEFYARSKAGVTARGAMHPLTATYVADGKRRILCLAMMPNEQSIPGYMDVPARGRIPSKCKIHFGGKTVGVNDWRVFEAKTSTDMPRHNTWWAVGERLGSGSLPPLFASNVPGADTLLCRGVDRNTGQGHPGVLSNGKCLISVNDWTVQHTNEPKRVTAPSFSLYLAQRNPGLRWSTPGTSIPSDALDFNAGNDHRPGKVVGCRRSDSDTLGYMRGGTCRVPGSSATGPFQVLVAPGSDRG